MTAYWKNWKEIVFKARRGNYLALVALYSLVETLPKFDYSTALDKWLEHQESLHNSMMLVTCDHTFSPTKENPDLLECAFCGNTAHKDNLAEWREKEWIREV